MGGNPQAMAIQLMRNNPKMAQDFDQFMQQYQGMTPSQVLSKNGIDPASLGFTDNQ